MKYKAIISLALAATLAISCSEDNLDSKSVFDTEQEDINSDFDNWLETNFTDPYNIRFNYRYSDKETDNTQTLIPADHDKAVALAIMIKHVWLDAFAEVAGEDFLRNYGLREIQLVGIPVYLSNNNISQEIQEGGIKATIYNVNCIDIDSVVIDTDNPFVNITEGTSDMNYWCFKTLNHILCHLLTGEKSYTEDFETISAVGYNSSGWVSIVDSVAPAQGFVSAYASKEYDDDFAEIFAIYITHSETAWQTILDTAAAESEDAKNEILDKLEIVTDYFKGTWELDIDDLRDVILRRYSEVGSLDLRTLN